MLRRPVKEVGSMARFTASGLTALALLVAYLASGVPARGQVLCQIEADDIAAMRSFELAVASYVEVHRRLDVGFMALWSPSDPEANAVASSRLAEAIRTERRDAARGDIFNPEVADFFRARLKTACRAGDCAVPDVPGGLGEESRPCVPLPEVNSRLTWATSIPIGEALRDMLPQLPIELEYRLAGRALVLVDVSADLVVDVLVDALP
jgi:hypothetical protein